jgi:hypothetical protein
MTEPNHNGDLGIEAAPGADGGGNKASGNGNPLQCVNVVCRPDTSQDIAGTGHRKDFDTNDVLEVDDQIPLVFGVATLHYAAPDGSVVVVHFSLGRRIFSGATTGNNCTMTGVAVTG